MRYNLFGPGNDVVLLVSRILLTSLFILFGWSKITGFSGTVDYMAHVGAPVPMLSAVIAVIMEFAVGILLLVGFYTRPLAVLLAIYTVATAFIGHHFWTMTGADQMANMINFYKNISIAGGLLALAVTGPGAISIDRK
ncbi:MULTISPECIES: DoxX family protein [Paraburkholderia]|uniref:Oxidoreductase n=4 Tax=Paraburkholderia TaxID=1822464 RepID=A0A2U1AG47_9BURK|nr:MULTISPECIES: DoxX family protein [Paraburkholderia]MBB2928754.1 putative oxidoreductase [Paraburkholderia silvatlantica]PVY35337.1 putative oxidoreductase [Paraburkholderia silvatlantica]PXW40979.1 putative oxidoreductase [Paraburkholderia silvatlantica]PYE27445.1 putative oxidoreductase [Paraburkholderia silvatlantica]TDQ98194.1 putative oxidoreductase [Paraburkholderia silvatlantica]